MNIKNIIKPFALLTVKFIDVILRVLFTPEEIEELEQKLNKIDGLKNPAPSEAGNIKDAAKRGE